MLIFQIAAGIVIAVLVLRFLPALMQAIVPFFGGALIAAVGIGFVAVAVWFFGNLKPIQTEEWPVLIAFAILFACFAAVRYYAPTDERGEGKIGTVEIVIGTAMLGLAGFLALTSQQ